MALTTIATGVAVEAIANHAIHNGARYIASVNKTFLVYQGTDYDVYARTFDHSTDTWSSAVLVRTAGALSADDSHGAPSMVIDASGYIHVFSGSHITPQFYTKSTNAHDISAWTNQTNLVASATYPNAFIASNGDMYVFYREGTHGSDWSYKKSTDGGASWGSAVDIIDGDASNAWYLNFRQDVADPDIIHIAFCWDDETGAGGTGARGSTVSHEFERYDAFYVKFDCSDDTLYEVDGTAVGTVPITKASADTDLGVTIGSGATPNTNIPFTCTDASGYPCLLYNTGSGTNHVFAFRKWNGSAWTTAVNIGNPDHLFDVAQLEHTGGTNFSAYIIDYGSSAVAGDVTGLADRGGCIVRYDSTDNGATWGVGKLIHQSGSGLKYDCLVLVRDYHDDVKLIASTISSDLTLFTETLISISDDYSEAALAIENWTGYAVHATAVAPSSTLNDFEYIIALDQMPSSWWTAAAADGDDIRVTLDAAGTTQLAIDLQPDFTHGGSSGSGTLICRGTGKVPSGTSRNLHIWAGNGSAAAYAVDHYYGRENVYGRRVRGYWPNGLGTDRTAFDNDMTATGSPTVGGASGPISGSDATTFDGTDDRGLATASASLAGLPWTLVYHGNPSSITGLRCGMALNASANTSNYFIAQNNAANLNCVTGTAAGGAVASQGTITTGTWRQFAARQSSATSRVASLNKTHSSPETTSRIPAGLNRISIGAFHGSSTSNYYAGTIAFAALYTESLTDAELDFRADMLADSDQSDFYGAWSWAVAGPPINSVAPAATGTEATGKTLSCTTGTWTGHDSLAYQWYTNTTASSSGGTAISGATSSTFVLTASQDDLYVYCVVTATNDEGSTDEPSNVVGPILGLTVVVKANPIFADAADFQDQTLINEAVGDAGAGEEMPAPSTWETDSPVGDVDWSAFTLAVDAASINRSNRAGATLISPNYVVLAAHAPGDNTGHTWMTPAGVEVTRTLGSTPDVDYWELGTGDLAVAKLSAAINNITPMPMILDCSKVAGRDALCIEMDRHLNVFTIPETLDNTDEDCTVTHSRASDGLESGDSGKPCVIIIDDTPVMVITAMYTASPGGPPFTGTGPNASHFIDEIFAITAEDGESPTVWDLQIASGGRASGIANSFASAFSSTGFPFYF